MADDTLPPPPPGVTFTDDTLPPPPAGVTFVDNIPSPNAVRAGGEPPPPAGVEWVAPVGDVSNPADVGPPPTIGQTLLAENKRVFQKFSDAINKGGNATAALMKAGFTNLEETGLSLVSPDLAARVLASKGNFLTSDSARDWADSLNQTNDHINALLTQKTALEAKGDTEGAEQARRLADQALNRRDALRDQNPANFHNRITTALADVKTAPDELMARQIAGITSMVGFFSDPLGESSQAAKAAEQAVLLAGEHFAEDPVPTVAGLIGSFDDPVYALVPAGGMTKLSKGFSDILATTGKQASLGLVVTGAASASAQVNATGHVDFGQTTDDVFHAIAPMTSLAFLGAGFGYAKGAREAGAPGMEGGPSPDLSTPEDIAEHHKNVFKDILNPEGIKPEVSPANSGESAPEIPPTAGKNQKAALESALAKLDRWSDNYEAPPVSKDEISEVAGNMAQKADKDPQDPMGAHEQYKALQEEVFPIRATVPQTALDQVVNTKALDENGHPLVVYRGQKIDAPGTGSFYSTSPDVANTYAHFRQDALDQYNGYFPPGWPTTTPVGEEPATVSIPGTGTKSIIHPILAPNVSKYVTDIRNPYVVEMGGKMWLDIGEHVDSGKKFTLGNFIAEDWFQDHPEYDGVIVRNVRDSAFSNAGDSPIAASTVVIPKSPEQAINFLNHKNRLQGGRVTLGTAAALGLGATGAAVGGYEDGLYGAVAGGVLGLLSPLAVGAVKNLAKNLFEKSSPNAADLSQEEFIGHMREARFAPLQLASQFKKIVSKESSERINAVTQHGPDSIPDKLTKEEEQVRAAGENIYQTYGKALEKAGVIDEMRKDYISRILKPRADMPTDFQKNWYTKLSPAKARKYTSGPEGLRQAYEDGFVLKHNRFEDNLAEYVGVAQELLAKNKYARALFTDGPEEGYNWVMPGSKAPRFYKPMQGGQVFQAIAKAVNKNLTPKWDDLSLEQRQEAYHWLNTEAGPGENLHTYLRNMNPNRLPVAERYAIHPDAADVHNFLFGTHDSNTFWRGFDVANLQLKQAKLSFTLFHAKTMIQHHLNLQDYGMANPQGYKDIPSVAAGTNPAFTKFLNNDPVTQLAIKHGLGLNPAEEWEGVNAATSSTEFNKWLNSVVPEEFRVPAAEGIYGKLLDAEDAFKKVTFGRFMTGFKLMDATSLFNKERMLDAKRVSNDPTYRIRSDDEIMKGVVKLVNNVYGVQDYARLVMDSRTPAMRKALSFAFSPTGRKYMQRLLLAPDWLISTTRALTGALGLQGAEAARLHAPYMVRSAFYYMLAANMVNMMNTGHTIFSNQDPLTVELGGGRTMMLDKAFSDPLKLYNVFKPAQMTQAWLSKGSPLVEETLEQLGNKQFLTPYGSGPPIVSRKDSALPYIGKRIAHATGMVLPIPAQQFIEDRNLQPVAGFLGFPIYSHRRLSKDYP